MSPIRAIEPIVVHAVYLRTTKGKNMMESATGNTAIQIRNSFCDTVKSPFNIRYPAPPAKNTLEMSTIWRTARIEDGLPNQNLNQRKRVIMIRFVVEDDGHSG